MTPNKSRFVTACQQLLALGLVVAALTPAANMISLTVVPEGPSGPAGGTAVGPATPMAAYARASTRTALVPTEVVDPTVTEYSLTAPTGARVVPVALEARTAVAPGGASEVTSRPQHVTGVVAIGHANPTGDELREEHVASFREPNRLAGER